tara:strand:+ start:538 stop:2418 length:1881 start_codon:yes stop_codon:yes gene_type:complete
MVSQLDRSAARKELTKLCSRAILDYLAANTSPKSATSELSRAYQLAVNVVLGVAIETMTLKSIPKQLTESGRILELLENISHTIDTVRRQKSIKQIISFIKINRKKLAEEDLGGVSELFSGHQAIWKNNDVELVHNPARRDSGKIYTPYDVTEYMCSNVAKAMVSRCGSLEELLKMKVLDPAIGSGAFCSQLVRVLWKKASRKWKLKDEAKFRFDICSKVIYSADIDGEALQLAKVVLWISAGCPQSGIEFNMANCDSLELGACEDKVSWNKITGFKVNGGFDVVFGNPPYVRVKPEMLQGFAMASTRNLYCAFTELALNLLNDDGLLCYIIPQSIVASKETLPLRQRLIDDESSLRMQIFDSVPDFLFDQGKIESNTNTNINQRTTIVLLNRNEKHSIYTSPLLRWRRREERDDLFKNLNQIKIAKSDIHNGAIPMLESRQDLELFRKLKRQKNTISDTIVKEGGRILFIPKAIRYFITAVPFDLERPNTIQLRVSEEYYHLIHSTLNSNLFYWWWRINGNGFQVEMKDILSFPILALENKIAAEFSKKLDDAVDDCRVFKHNAGKQIPNINYNYKQELLQELDNELLKTINMTPHKRVFGCKTNSLFGKMEALRGYMRDRPSHD